MPDALREQKIRCVLFDLGDTLWYRKSNENWEKLEDEANQRAVDLLRQRGDPALFPVGDDRVLGRRLHQSFENAVRSAIRGTPLLEPDPPRIAADVLRAWGLPQVDRSLCTAFYEALRVRIHTSRSLFADALSTLAELRRRGYELGIVTNRLWGGEPFLEDLSSMGVLDYFDRRHIAISADLGMRKPNAQIFQRTLDALQVTSQETAMVGDSLSADILGAQPLGIYAIWKPKPWLSEWATAHAATYAVPGVAHSSAGSAGAFPGEDTADTYSDAMPEAAGPPPGHMLASDDDHVLARASAGRDYLDKFRRGEIRPDRVIARLAELLEVFPGVYTS